MGIKLSSVYQTGELIISEISIRTPNTEELPLLEKGIDEWKKTNPGENIQTKKEGFIVTVSAEFKLDQIQHAEVFTKFITNFIEGNSENKDYLNDGEVP
jgi:hypothetical protein